MGRTDPLAGPDAPFPLADHFPLGRPFGAVTGVAEPASADRPFGITLARRPRQVVRVDRAGFRYEEDRQLGTVHDEGGVVPLGRHTDGTTNTVTDGGDGQDTNKDSDSDARED